MVVVEHVTWFRQAALRWQDAERTVYFDPWGTGEDPAAADLILITHAHFDHFRPDEIDRLRRPGTKLVAPHDVASELTGDVTPVRPGEVHVVGGVHIMTVPAYNTREEALSSTPRATGGLGTWSSSAARPTTTPATRITRRSCDDVRSDVAFLPIGGHFTMDWRAAADLARAIAPSVAVPIHYGFVICSPSDGMRFRDAAAPVPVELVAPVDDFEQE